MPRDAPAAAAAFDCLDYDPVARILDDLRDFQASTLDRPDGRPGLGRSDSSGGRRVSAADGGGSGGITAGSGGRPGWDEYLEHQLRDMVRGSLMVYCKKASRRGLEASTDASVRWSLQA